MKDKLTQHKDIFNLITKSILAGALIALAGLIYLKTENKIVGSFLFSLGLCSVLVMNAKLYTGAIGYLNSWRSLGQAMIMLVFNLLTAYIMGLIFRGIYGTIPAMDSRLVKTWYEIFFDALGCGACIFLGVELYKKTKNFLPVVLCVMAFILAGFEHTVADAMYLGISEPNWIGFGYVILIAVGNSLGSLALRVLQLGLFREE